MADMIAAPKHDVVAKFHGVLDNIILEDKAILPNFDVVPDEGARTNIRKTCVALPLSLREEPRAQAIQLGVRDGDEGYMLRGVVSALDLFKMNHRQTEQTLFFCVRAFYRKGNHLMRRVVREVLVRQFG